MKQMIYRYSVIMLLAAIVASSVARVRASHQEREAAQDGAGKQPAPAKVPLERGTTVEIGNRTTGRITITGWDNDYIEATATSARGLEAVRVNTSMDGPQKKILLKADHFDSEIFEDPAAWSKEPNIDIKIDMKPTTGRDKRLINPPYIAAPADTAITPNPAQIASPARGGTTRIQPQMIVKNPREIDFDLKLPRYAEIEAIKVFRSDVEIKDIDTPVIINGDRSTIRLTRVAAAEVKTNSGAIEVDGVAGLVDAITKSGNIKVSNASSDVRAISISGSVEVRCARGRVDISNANGPITLANVKGDVDATTINKDVRFVGPISENGRYRLKSMSGAVEMLIPAGSPGFTVALASYRGGVTTDFALKTSGSTEGAAISRRLIGRHGNGQAQLSLDSFDGAVRLAKAAPDAAEECK